MPELVLEGFDKLADGLTIKAPATLRRMAFNVDANVASAGRRQEQRDAHNLEMGKLQRKGRITRVFSKWDSEVGWVSTTRQAGKGGTGFRMASFGWERVRKATVTAPYSSQLVNLWGKATKAYTRKSPVVGQPGRLIVWGTKGHEKRPQRYYWSKAFDAMSRAVGPAIARTEKNFLPQLEEII